MTLSRLNTAARISLLLLTSLLLLNCRGGQSDVDKLKSQNDSLVQLLVRESSEVSLKNSAVKELKSTYTGEIYDVYISYPGNYKNSGKTYPALLVLDAEVNFGATTYISQRLTKDELIPEHFIIGIAYKGDTEEDTYYSLRAQDFTPTSDTTQENHNKNKYKSGTGGAENFVKFLSLELFPFLESTYPIKKEGKTIYGHSFGGLFGTHVLLNHPTLFDNYLLLSPSLWWNEKVIFKDLVQNTSGPSKTKIYMATGSLEQHMVDDHLAMARFLQKRNSNIKSEILDQETHRSIFGRGFTNGLRFLYSK